MSGQETRAWSEDKDSVSVTKGQTGKYGFELKLYVQDGRMSEKIAEIDQHRKDLEARLNTAAASQ